MNNKINKPIIKFFIVIVAILGIATTLVYITYKPETSDQSKLNVTASFYPIYDFAKNIGGDKVNVTNITPAGSEPHDYEPSPAEIIKAQQSDVFIYNGAGMEGWVDNFLNDYSEEKVIVKANNNIEMISLGDSEVSEFSMDPHFWLDPVLAIDIVENIKNGFIEADPTNQLFYEENAETYKTKLKELDADFVSTFDNCTDKVFLTAHKAFSYIAKRYDLEALSIAGISPDEEPSPAKLAELTDIVKNRNIKYVFFESLTSPKIAETIASETGAKTEVLDPIEGLTDEEQQTKDYIIIQRENLEKLKESFTCVETIL